VSAFEAVSVGVAASIDNWKKMRSFKTLEKKIKRIWDDADFRDNSGMGVSGKRRAQALVPYGKRVFKK
jgi:hypothetical protein